MGFRANFYLSLVLFLLVMAGSAVAAPVPVAEVCTCEAVVECTDGDTVLLKVQDRKSQCGKYLGQELQKVKDSPLPYCSDRKYPEKVEEFTTKDCEKAQIELWHCRDDKEGSKLCDLFRKFYDFKSEDSRQVRVGLDSLIRQLVKLRGQVEATLQSFNDPLPVPPPPVSFSALLEEPPVDDGGPFPEEDPATPVEKPTPIRHFLDESLGLKARWLADQYCTRRKISFQDGDREQTAEVIKKLSRELTYFQETAKIYPITSCTFDKVDDIKSLRAR
jgi:hypothetical protein